ncbi:MAG: hypothetical protein ACK4Z0_09265 [Sphingomonadaceae bacterium]
MRYVNLGLGALFGALMLAAPSQSANAPQDLRAGDGAGSSDIVTIAPPGR